MSIRPMITKKTAEALLSLLGDIPASTATKPENLRAVEYIRDLAAWRLAEETQKKRDDVNAKIYAHRANKTI